MTNRRNFAPQARAVRFGTALLLALGACAHEPKSRPGPVLVQPTGNEQRIEDVVVSLKAGDTRRARKLLRTLSRQKPVDARVVLLTQGLDGDPVQSLGAASFTYRVVEGDQLTSLAQRYLGDRLKFYMLARYNGLTADALQTGQLVRIPGAAPLPKPKSEARPEPRPEIRSESRREPRAALPASLPRTGTQTPSPPPNPQAASKLRGLALAALNRGAVANAVVLLRRAQALNPGNLPIRNDLARAERLLSVVRARR